MSKSALLYPALALALVACVEGGSEAANAGRGAPQACVDRDGDGFGKGCDQGPDCNDQDKSVASGCVDCQQHDPGCACKEGDAPEPCFLDLEKTEAGELLCHEGTRYCREGVWSVCEDVFTYPLPQERRAAALIDVDAGPVSCNACDPVCFRVTDNLDPLDGGLSGTSDDMVSWSPGGGLTLGEDEQATQDLADASVYDPSTCIKGTAPDVDCDGIPDEFDAYPNNPPFATNNPAIFLQLGPGETGTGSIDISFFLNSADIYFLVDQTGSMSEERDQLKADLVSGNFINDPSYNCADYDNDGQPNNELKDGGIIGAIRCMIRDSSFGVGFFREIPFSGYASDDYVAFANYQDITTSVSDVYAGVEKLTTLSNIDWPEASPVALYTLMTGSGMYFGYDKTNILPRTDCPAGHWGYPCFRDEAIPIVIMFTDAQMHNGPANNDFPYDATKLGIAAGTDGAVVPIPPTNDTFDTLYDAGDVTNKLLTFAGNTSSLNADITQSSMSCLSSDTGADAMYSFTLSSQKSVLISTEGSSFDTVLGLFADQPLTPTTLPASSNSNETANSATSLGQMVGSSVKISGSTATMAPNYSGSTVGCSAATAAPEAVYSFTANADATVSISTEGSSLDTVVALYDKKPVLLPTFPASANTNDTFATVQELGTVNGGVVAAAGNTAASSIHADFSASSIGCSAHEVANDAVYGFTLSSPTRVRVSSEGSSFDTVLGLLNDTCGGGTCTSAAPITSSLPASAETLGTAFSIGSVEGQEYQLTGSTSGMAADYDDVFAGCGADATTADTLVRFDLASATDVVIGTSNTSWDHVLSLYGLDMNNVSSVVATNTNETTSSPQDLGALDGKVIKVQSGDTTGMDADYVGAQLSCAPNTTGSGDAVYSFTLSSPTRVRVDTVGSAFDTMVSLHDAPVDASLLPTAVSMPSTAEAPRSAYVLGTTLTGNAYEVAGNTSSMAADISMNGASGTSCHSWSDDTGADAVVKFTVTQAGTYDFDLESSFTGSLALYPSAASPYAVPWQDMGTAGSSEASSIKLGTLDDWWVRRTGTTTNDFWSDSSCNARSNARDVMYEFTLDSTRTMEISTSGSDIDSVVQLYKWNNASHTSYSSVACDDNISTCGRWSWNCTDDDDGLINQSLSAGDYFVIVTGERNRESGGYKLSIRDTSLGSDNKIDCAGNSTSVSLSKQLNPGTYYAVVKGYQGSEKGNFTLTMSDSSLNLGYGDAHMVACSDNASGLGTASAVEEALPAGTYYVVVSGSGASDSGSYQLTLQDMDSPPVGAQVACDNSTTAGKAEIATLLDAGTYFLMVKGTASAAEGSYDLTIRDASAKAAEWIACNNDGGDSSSSVLERDLAAGHYFVVVKGDGSSDEGDYKLSVRDVTSSPMVSALVCDRDSGTVEASSLQANVVSGKTYYVVVKGDAATDAGAYTLAVADVNAMEKGGVACSDDIDRRTTTSRIQQTLNAGTYYVAVKGNSSSDSGDYQLTIGGAAATSSKYVPPTWSETLAALNAHDAKVIPILSCFDDPYHGDGSDCTEVRTQATALANATETFGDNLAPLVVDISSDGSGLSNSVVNGVASLAQYLEMDVKVVVSFDPDPNPGFNVWVNAIDEPGDGCTGTAGGNEHLKCRPGATPRFDVTFENPLDSPVPANPNDPNGGYNFRAQLIGNDNFVVDEVPIYIIPEPAAPPPPVYYSSGEYWQDLESKGCLGTQRPDWHDLTWNAEVPTNTQIEFLACAAESTAALDTCTPVPIATIAGTSSCTSDADCGVGYCDLAVGACQVATGASCTSDDQCPVNATCMTGACTFSSQPVYVGDSLGADNYLSFLRVKIVLSGDPPVMDPPVLHNWELTYLCVAAD